MKRNLVFAVISFCCLAVVSIDKAHASAEGWWPEWYQCNGYVKKWAADWHTHSSSGWPYKHLMKSSIKPGADPNFSTYVPHTGSPWYQTWDSCVAPLQLQRWYFFNDCNVIQWCWNCGQCRPMFTVEWIPYESTYPQPCQPP